MRDKIEVRGARVHNLKNIDVDIPLGGIVGVAGVSGSGKSSLALGVLYAEGSRRYLESLSTYTRRRMTQAEKAQVDEVLYIPAALALRQRPGVPGIRSTFGTGTELLNSLRLMFSRLASHRCPNGHYVPPSLAVASGMALKCPECGEEFYGPSAEELAFNSQGACPKCNGTGTVWTVDRSTLVPDETLTIEQGAVAPWNSLMWSIMVDVCREMGVRTDVPFNQLTERERDIVFDGPPEKRHILYHSAKTNQASELDFTYYSAVYTVENALSKVKDEQGMKRVAKFLKQEPCPDCGGSRLSDAARAPLLRGINLADACRMTLTELVEWVRGVPASLPEEMRPMAESICEVFQSTAKRLMDLGLGYLTLDRAAGTLSTGERQRMQLARAVRNRTTGVLYVLDEPSIGLHPANITGLTGVMRDLVADGNSVVLVDHDTQVLGESDYIIEMGPGAGASGGTVIAQGTVEEIERNPASRIGPFLAGVDDGPLRPVTERGALFDLGRIHLSTGEIHTVKPMEVDIPRGRLTVVTGVSGSGKTTLILESLVPALQAKIDGRALPAHVRAVEADGVSQVKLIDATPIGINVRSTVATYANVHDELRKVFARTPGAKERGYKAGDFSYNSGFPALPGLRRNGADKPGRAVPAGRGHPLSGVPRQPVREGGKPRALCGQTRRELFAARADGHGREYGARRLRGAKDHTLEIAGAQRPRSRLPDARRGHAQPLRGRGAAAQARQRDGQAAVGRRVRLRRADNRPPPAGCAQPAGGVPDAYRRGRDRYRHRARPRRDTRRRLRHRHGPGRRRRGRARCRLRHAGGHKGKPRERDRQIYLNAKRPRLHSRGPVLRLFVLFVGDDGYVQLVELLLRDLAGRAHHEILCVFVHREGDDLAY